ncbi:heme-degrading domain-containing protein [Demequina sp. NBRC 110052]|uniref:heme-degrading domain-containing protein n=1 Tax=Demequina sp. NBRC 110052 TaxID=1570341 RepID=UPI0009FB9602|nr:heme-degrading domain-containing protein [Demequina sp. NBRC 110052]
MTSSHDDLNAELAVLRETESTLVLTRFTHADAWTLGSWLVERGRRDGLGITVDIRKGDQQVFHAALEGTTPDNDDWIERKVRTVRRFSTSSLIVGRSHAAKGVDFNDATQLPFTEYVAHGGCVPVRIAGVGMVGTLTVSGLKQEDDHALAVEALQWLQGVSAGS